jgi:uncharacterized protein YdeI (YjbR/CyaY-like superfamily)
MGKSVDDYYEMLSLWPEEQRQLRKIVTSFELDEAMKWLFPAYSADGKNVVAIVGFKGYFGLWFFEGAKLEDSQDVLTNAQPGKTKMMRQWRMKNLDDIRPDLIRAYIDEAIEKTGGRTS